jgi:hypothetical protein
MKVAGFNIRIPISMQAVDMGSAFPVEMTWGYVAGFFDGEGSVLHRTRLQRHGKKDYAVTEKRLAFTTAMRPFSTQSRASSAQGAYERSARPLKNTEPDWSL